jgi:tetratricopeptide (TPR) repeat protein
MTLPSAKRYWLMLAAFLTASFAVFGPSLSGPFVFDDSYQFFAAPRLPAGSPWGYLLGARPVVQISYYLTYLVAADNPAAYRAVDIALHAVNATLVALAIHFLLQTAYANHKRADLVAIIGGTLFLLHTLQSEAVCYISARSDILCSLFFLLALNIFLYFRPQSIGWLQAVAIPVLFLLALGSKEIAIALPFVLGAYEWIFRKRVPSVRHSGAWRLYGLLAAGAAAGIVVVLRYIGAGSGVTLKPDLPYFFTQWRALFTYVQLLIWPAPLNLDRDFPISQTPLDHGALFYLLALIAAFAILLWKRDREGLVLFGVLFALFVLGPTSSFLPIQDPISERRMYLPMAGVAFALPAALLRLPIPDKRLILVASLIGAVYAVMTYQRAEVWSSAISLWSDTASKSPGKFRTHFWLGQAYLNAGRCTEALASFDEAQRRIGKDDPELHFFRASAYACNNQHLAAADEMSKSLALKGPNAQALAFRATYYARAGDLARAHADLDEALRVDPNSVPALSTRGRIYLAEGRFAESVADLERAVRLFPQDGSLTLALDEARRRLRASQP